MKSLLAAFLIATTTSSAFAQQVIDVDKTDNIPQNTFFTVSGSPVVTARFVRLVAGTPYFSEKWMKGVALSANGDRYRSPRVKLDLLDNQLYFLNDKEQEFVCTTPLKEITLTDTVSGTVYHFVHASAMPLTPAKKGWYQVLAKGNVPVYRHVTKILNENKPYGSSVSEQKITTVEEFLIGYNNTLYSTRKLKEVPAILSNKKAELDKYLDSDVMKQGTNAEKMVALVAYYNTLQ